MSDAARRRYHEAAHKLGPSKLDGNGTPRVRRSFNEAAHKLGYWPVTPAPRPALAGTVRAPGGDHERDIGAHAGRLVLALGALGVVYGDLGTSPLYTEQFIFGLH